MLIRVVRSFRFAYEGVRVVEYIPGVVDVPEECGRIALLEGWADAVNAGLAASAEEIPASEAAARVGTAEAQAPKPKAGKPARRGAAAS